MPSNPTRRDLRDDFKDVLPELTIEAVCGRKYMQVEKLRQWMKEGNPRRVDTLLSLSQHQKDSFSLDPNTLNKITHGEKSSLIVFSILLELDKGVLIHDLRRHRFFDSKLPIDLATVERVFCSLKTLISEADLAKRELAKRFDKMQWKYCPLRFDFGDHVELLHNQVLPICAKQRIKEGGTAIIYQISVQEKFVGDALQREVPDSRYEDKEYGLCFHFALKTYKDGNETLFDNESTAFRGLRQNRGMIKCLHNFSHVENEAEGVTTNNLLLEYGEFDLSDYFSSYLPPGLEEEQLSFWSDLFLVAHAVKDIHEFKHSSVGETVKYFGWHADIKPDNILNVQGEFKLADPGFARFERQEKEAEKGATAYMGGTSTFGAPECYAVDLQHGSRSSVDVTRTIDIWSLGCVFSFAATWMVFGKAGIDQFNLLRQEAIRKATQTAGQGTSLSSQPKRKLAPGDYFHDGQNVLPAVLEWHNYLRRCMRKNDCITEKVLEVVERHMLVREPNSRISAVDLCNELRAIKEKAKDVTKNIKPVHDTIKSALQLTEERWHDAAQRAAMEAESKERNVPEGKTTAASGLIHGRRNSHFHKTAIQTSHRSKVKLKVPNHPRDSPYGPDFQRQHQAHSRLNISASIQEVEERPTAEPETMIGPSGQYLVPVDGSVSFAPVSSPSIAKKFTTLPFFSPMRNKSKANSRLERNFQERDLVILVDNGGSMAHYWEELSDLVHKLATRAKNVDKNGIDLQFTVTESRLKPSNKSDTFKKEVLKDDNLPKQTVQTNMAFKLGKILEEYLDSFDRGRNKTRKRTVIVLTDGKWLNMPNRLAVDNVLVDFIQKFQVKRQKLREEMPNMIVDERYVSIQFVQFGEDKQASKRLWRLDTQLKWKGVPNIVDHKPSDADLDKIITGSTYESDDEESEAE